MSKKINHFSLGLFFLIGVAIALGGLMWVGVAHFFENTRTYATFFNQSVGGLSPGAEVDYLGVKVGRVSSVQLAENDRLVKVLLQIDTGFKVKGDMAVELKLKGITGQQLLAIVKAPDNIKQVTPTIDFPVDYPVIPSTKGQIQQIEAALEKIYQKVKSVDLGQLVAAWEKAAKDVDSMITGEKVQRTLANIQQTSSDLKRFMEEMRKAETSGELSQTLSDLSQAADSARKASEVLARQLEGLPPHTFSDVAKGMEQIVKTSERSINAVEGHVDQSMALVQQSLVQINQVLAEVKELVESLRESPGRILTRPRGGEPFER